MNRIFAALAVGLTLTATASSAAAPADRERTVRQVRFAKGTTSTVIKGNVKGYNYVDYQLRASAGQTLKAGMQVSNLANHFNINAPDSGDVSMFIAGGGSKVFEGMLPADGTYTIRVYLMRAAARRKEGSDYSLSVSIEGKPLKPVSDKIDATIPGTPYHASTTVKCMPAYSKVRECPAYVVRRSFDGTATVEIRWDHDSKRRILFIKGKPVAADAPTPFTFTKNGDQNIIDFGSDERFEIPDALIFGG